RGIQDEFTGRFSQFASGPRDHAITPRPRSVFPSQRLAREDLLHTLSVPRSLTSHSKGTEMAINYSQRLERTRAKMDEVGIGLLYLPPSTNLEWLMGIPRERPGYTNIVYPGGWLNGAFVGLTRGPILAVPRMFAEFDLGSL